MQRGLVLSLLGALLAGLSLVGCGADEPNGPGASLESWRVAACEVLTTYGEEQVETATQDGDFPSFESGDEFRRYVDETEEAVERLRAIPLPNESRADAKRLIALFAVLAARSAEAAPMIEEASRRLSRALESIDPDDLPPPPEKPTTVAGGIMSQLMSDPEVADAYADLMRAYASAVAGIDEKEADRVAERLGMTECLNPEQEQELSTEALARCGSRGSPVTVQELVRVAREHGITLDTQQGTCGKKEGEKVAGFDSDATNAGPDGLDQPEERRLREGHVLCDVADKSSATGVRVTKYPTDSETSITAANVQCTIYPHSPTREAAQVRRLKTVMEAVADLAATRR